MKMTPSPTAAERAIKLHTGRGLPHLCLNHIILALKRVNLRVQDIL
jgi:hypothetical protein